MNPLGHCFSSFFERKNQRTYIFNPHFFARFVQPFPLDMFLKPRPGQYLLNSHGKELIKWTLSQIIIILSCIANLMHFILLNQKIFNENSIHFFYRKFQCSLSMY